MKIFQVTKLQSAVKSALVVTVLIVFAFGRMGDIVVGHLSVTLVVSGFVEMDVADRGLDFQPYYKV